MAKIRKFRAGDTVVDTSDAEEAKNKITGLMVSNAEREAKPTGFFSSLSRLFEGNIDEKGSDAYNKYGAGYGRKIEARNDELKAKTLKYAADEEKRISDAARDAEDARIKAANKKIADIKERAAAAESDYRGPMERRKLDVSEPVKAPATKALVVKTVSAAAPVDTRLAETGNSRGSRAAEPADTRLAETGNSRGSRAAEPADSRTAEAGNSRGSRAADSRTAEAGNSRGSRAAPKTAPAAAPAAPAASAPAEDSYADDTSLSLEKRSELRKKRNAQQAKTGTPTNYRPANERLADFFKAKGGAIKSYAKGGSVSAASRGDGIAQRGKTRGRMC